MWRFRLSSTYSLLRIVTRNFTSFVRFASIDRLLSSHRSYCVERCYAMKMCVCMSATNCHREEMAGLRSVNVCTRMYVDKVWSSTNFRANRRRPWPSLNKVKDSNRVHWVIHSGLSRKRWQIGHTLLSSTNRNSHVAFRLAYLYLTLAF